jgi:hypothetical protein
MNYGAALTDFFKSPKWMMNLLLGAVCCLIPVVGPLVYMGWLITGFWGREDERPETFPDFDFNFFTKYLERGVWPFVVMLVVSMVMVIPMIIVMFVMTFGMAAASQGQVHDNEPPIWLGLGFVGMSVFMIVMIFLMHLILVPLMLRSCRTQNLSEAFSFSWSKDFIGRMWLDILLSMIVLTLMGMVLMVIGYLMICVGAILVMPLIYFMWFHVEWQLYKVYLSRGGQPVPLSPKLRENTPPPLQPASL